MYVCVCRPALLSTTMDCSSFLRDEEEEFHKLFAVLMCSGASSTENTSVDTDSTTGASYNCESDQSSTIDAARKVNSADDKQVFQTSTQRSSQVELEKLQSSTGQYNTNVHTNVSTLNGPEIDTTEAVDQSISLDRSIFNTTHRQYSGSALSTTALNPPAYYNSIGSNKDCDNIEPVDVDEDDNDSENLFNADAELFKIPLVITEELDNITFDLSTDSADSSCDNCCSKDGGCFVDDLDLDVLLGDDCSYHSPERQSRIDCCDKESRYVYKRSKSFDLAESSYCDTDDDVVKLKGVNMDGYGDTIRMNTIKMSNYRRYRDWMDEGNNNSDGKAASPGTVNAYQRYMDIGGATLNSSSTDDGAVQETTLTKETPPVAHGWKRDKKSKESKDGLVDNILGFIRRTPKRNSKNTIKRHSWSPGLLSGTCSPGVANTAVPHLPSSSLSSSSQRTRDLAIATPRPPLPDISMIAEVPGLVNSRLSSGEGFIFSQDVRSSRKTNSASNQTNDKPSKRHSCTSEIMRAARTDTLERLKKESLKYGLKNKLWESGDQLLLDLLDDIDDISAGGAEAHRRRKARDLFADWLFNDVASPTKQTPSSTPGHRRSSREAFNDFLLYKGHDLTSDPPPSSPSSREAGSGADAGPASHHHSAADLRLLPDHLSVEEDAESGYHTGDSLLQHRVNAAAKNKTTPTKSAHPHPTSSPAHAASAPEPATPDAPPRPKGWAPSKSISPPGGAVRKEPSNRTLNRQELAVRIEAFNKNQHGLPMTLTEDQCGRNEDTCPCYQGFIRVYMQLTRPISMVLPSKAPSLTNLTGDALIGSTASLDRSSLEETGEITSFYLPKDTTKAIHINSETSAHEVIKILLTKFYITDNPHKFALYEKVTNSQSEVTMKRLSDTDEPLPLCLSWTAEGLNNHQFVLQDNDTEEVMWDAFSTPELETFLRILSREENEYLEQVRSKYQLLRIQMNRRLEELRAEKKVLLQAMDATDGGLNESHS